MNKHFFSSIQFRILALVGTISLVIAVFMALVFPFKASTFGTTLLLRDAEYITRLLSDNLAISVQASILDEGESVRNTLASLNIEENIKDQPVLSASVFNTDRSLIASVNSRVKGVTVLSDNITDNELAESLSAYTYIDEGECLTTFSPLNMNNDIVGYLKLEFSKAYVSTNVRSFWLFASLAGIASFVIAMLVGLFVAGVIITPINRTSSILKDIAEGEGDLAQRLPESNIFETGLMAVWFNTFVDKLKGIISEVKTNADNLSDASEDLSSTSHTMSSIAEQMNQQFTTVTSSGEHLSQNINSVASGAEQMSTTVDNVATAIEQMNMSINQIATDCEKQSTVTASAAEQAQASQETMNQFGKSAAEIGKIVEVITNIADQTNLLSLNATIEAARAGETGKGFAVVAAEIKELASESAESTKRISAQIEQMQGKADEVVRSMKNINNVFSEVQTIFRTIASAVEEQSTTISGIAHNMGEVNHSALQIAKNINSAAKESDDISNSIREVDSVSRQTASSAAETNTSAKELRELSKNLSNIVKQFKI